MVNRHIYLENSILLDVFNYPNDSYELKRTVIKFTDDFIHLCIRKNGGRDFEICREMIRQLLLNGIVSMITERPIAISLNRNSYGTSKRLGKIKFNYTFLKKCFDSLVLSGWFELAPGHRNKEKQGKVTRFWCSQKFIDYFSSAVTKPPVRDHDDENCLILKKHVKNTKSKHVADYNDNDHPEIPQMRKDLEIINTVANKHSLSLCLTGTVVPDSFLEFIKTNQLLGDLEVSEYSCHYKMSRILTDNVYQNVKDDGNYKFTYHDYRLVKRTNNDIKLNTLSITPLFNSLHLSNDDHKKYFNFNVIKTIKNECLDWISAKGGQDYYYLNQMKMDFKYNSLKRIFMDDFDHCGRFFNLYQRVPSDLRRHLLIDGEPTVEVDIKACVLQMLYHYEELECPENPYSLLSGKKSSEENALENSAKITSVMPSKEDLGHLLQDTSVLFPITLSFAYTGLDVLKMKKFHKFAQIVMVNAMDKIYEGKTDEEDSGQAQPGRRRKVSGEESAIRAIYDELRDNDYGNYAWNDVVGLINKFRDIHDPIKHHLFSGIGLQLQNIESKIVNKVLLHFAKKDIFCLCIHDSLRIAVKYKDELIEVFKESYKAELGFTPALSVE